MFRGFSIDQVDLEQYHIANSGVNGTCKYNPCENGGLCFYTPLLNDYFCQCNTCYSGPYCGEKSCNSDDVNLSFFKNIKLIRLDESSYYIVACVFFVFVIAIWCSTQLCTKFETNAKHSKNENVDAEFCYIDQESLSTKLINN